MTYIVAIPAYGRDYTRKTDVLADWNANKDFLVQDFRSSGYINKQDAAAANIKVQIRYDKMRKVVVV